MIEALNINLRFGNRQILNNINLKIIEGDYISIIGPSGAGKTTFLNIISTLEKRYTGSIFYDKINVRDLNDFEVSRLRNNDIGFVFQNFNLLDDFTVIENIMLPARLTLINESKLKQKANNLIKRFGLSLAKNRYPNNLSGGEKQRVAIARALINKPKIIFADEPTGNLDTTMSNDISNILSNLNNDGQTIIIVTHNKDLAKKTKTTLNIVNGIMSE